jgi:hypothetical protein
MRKFYVLLALCLCCLQVSAQQYINNTPETIPAMGMGELYDTLQVSGLNQAILNGTFGLDSITLNINYPNDPDLTMELIAPDGTHMQLANWPGGGGANFTNTCFDWRANTFVGYVYPVPFTGHMQPEGWIGMLNNSQPGNGSWVLHVVNTFGSDTGVVVNWGLYFDSTPAPAPFFDSSTLPIVVINTGDTVVPYMNGTEVHGMMGIINNGAGVMNHLDDPYNNYNGHIRISVRGNSSRYFPTKSYDVETEDAQGNNNNVSLLGLSSDNDWILYAPWDDKSMMRNIITYQLSNEMGEYASRTRLCEVVQNGDYRGVYVLMEKIKQGSNRVNIHKLTANDNSLPALSGGYIYEVDKGVDSGYDYWSSNYLPCDSAATGIQFVYSYPKKSAITPAQRVYIANYTDSFENALKNVSVYDLNNGYRKYINMLSFIDQALLQEIGHNVDGYRLSSYVHKDRNGKLYGGPVWDFNEAFGNSDYDSGWVANTFIWDRECPYPEDKLNPFWWKKFLTDTNYVSLLKCRYSTLRQDVYDTVHIDHMIDSLAGMLAIPQQRHYMRWPIMGTYEWPEHYVSTSYDDELNYLKGWIQQRVQWMDTMLYTTYCPDTSTVNGIKTIAGQNIQVYPNPSNDAVTITSTDIINKLALYNMMGQQVYLSNEQQNRYQLSFVQLHLSKGVYQLLLYTKEGIVQRKLVYD